MQRRVHGPDVPRVTDPVRDWTIGDPVQRESGLRQQLEQFYRPAGR